MGLSRLAIAGLALSTALSGAAHAQTQRSGGENQKFMQQYQQMASERTAMQAQIVQLKKDLETAQADLSAVKKERDALKSHPGASPVALAQAVASKQTAEQSLEQSNRRMNELVGKYKELAQNLKETETDRNKTRQELAERNAAFDSCAVNNVKLYEITNEVLDRYEHVGTFTKVSAAEPFTRLTRTRIENLSDDYRTRAEELRVKRAKPSP